MSILEKKKGEEELQPLSREEALESIKQFRQDFHLTDVSTDRREIQAVLKQSGLISDAITESRRE
jgi:hypothetical protein